MIESVKISGIVYEVIEQDEPIIWNNHRCYGLCDYEALTIEIDSKMPRQRQEQTLLHEIVHGICTEQGIIMPEDVVEDVVDALATGLYHLIKDNPKLLTQINDDIIDIDDEADKRNERERITTKIREVSRIEGV